MRKKREYVLIFITLITLFSFSVLAGDLFSLQGNVDNADNTKLSSGGLVVEIWDGPDVAGSNLVYNSTDNFTGSANISNGKFDIILGNALDQDQLHLEYGRVYYMDLYVEGEDMNFSGQERQPFMSSIGTINSSFLNASNDYTMGSLTVTNITASNIILNVSNGIDLIVTNATGVDFDSGTLYVDPINNRVGVGTAAPGFMLDVAGTPRFQIDQAIYGSEALRLVGSASTLAVYMYMATALASYNVYLGVEGSAGGAISGGTLPYAAVFAPSAAQPIQFASSNVARLTIDAAGNVGIGTITPNYLLEVVGNASFGDTLFVTNDSKVGIGTSSPGATLEITNSSAQDLLLNVTNGATPFAYNSTTGRVGIGTTNPSYVLDVAGDMQLNSGDGVDYIYGGGTTSAYVLLTNGASAVQGSTGLTLSNVNSAAAGSDIVFHLGSGTGTGDQGRFRWLNGWPNYELMRLQADGRLGIGSSDPVGLVHINSSYLWGSPRYTQNDSAVDLFVLEHSTNTSGALGSGLGPGMMFRTIDDSLEVENVSMIAGIMSNINNGSEVGALAFYAGSADENGQITTLSSSEKMRITGEGKVGIGTSSPGATLEVTNSSAADVLFNVSDGSNEVLLVNSTVANFDSGTLYVDVDNNVVGIGTNSPTSALTLPNSSSGITLYNSDDQTTNYERGTINWTGNTFTIKTEKGGSGTARNLQLTSAGTISLTSGTGSDLYITAPAAFQITWGGGYVIYATTNTIGPYGSTEIDLGSRAFHYTSAHYAFRDGAFYRDLYVGGGYAGGVNVTGILTLPGAPTVTPSTSGGSMADGTYYYVLTATSSTGETLNGTQSAAATISGGGGAGSVALTWTAINGAKSYNIYRTTTSADYTTPAFIANVVAVSYTDIAADPSAGAPPASDTSGNLLVENRVGIGTTSPGATLEVTNSSAADVLLNVSYGMDSQGDYILVNRTGVSFDNDTLFVNTENNRVGIGTTNPTQALDVNGNILANTVYYGADVGGASYSIAVSNPYSWYTNAPTTMFEPTAGGGTFYIGYYSSYGSVYLTANTDLIVSSPTKGVGIGTTVPKYRLEVLDNASLSDTLFVTNSSTVGIGTSSPTALLHLENTTSAVSDAYLNISDGNTQKVLVLPNGLVAIQPTAGTIYYSNEKLRIGGAVTSDSGGPDLAVNGWIGTSSGIYMYSSAILGARQGDLQFQVTGSPNTEVMRLTTTGNVGIGTSTPSMLLDVNGDANLTGKAYIGNSTLYVDGSNVGIGTTSPGATLEVTNNTAADVLFNVSDGDDAIVVNATGTNFDSGTLYIDEVNNMVGIGATNPSSPLDVIGNIEATTINVNSVRDIWSQNIIDYPSSGVGPLTISVPPYNDGTLILSAYLTSDVLISKGKLRIENTSTAVSNAYLNISDGTTSKFVVYPSGSVVIGNSGEAPANDTMLLTIAGGDLNVSGMIFYNILGAQSPMVIQSAHGEPIPICMKNSKGSWVGCMPDENNNWACKPNKECDEKILTFQTERDLKAKGLDDKEIGRKVESIRQNFKQGKTLQAIKDEVRAEIGDMQVLNELDDTQPSFSIQSGGADAGEVDALRNRVAVLEEELINLKTWINQTQTQIPAEQIPVETQPAESVQEPVQETPSQEQPVEQIPLLNNAPVIDGFMPGVVPVMSVGDSQEFTVVVSDADIGDVLTVQWFVDDLPVADETLDAFTFAASAAGSFAVKVLVTDGEDYVTKEWTLTVNEAEPLQYGITGAAVSIVNKGGNSLLGWLKSLF